MAAKACVKHDTACECAMAFPAEGQCTCQHIGINSVINKEGSKDDNDSDNFTDNDEND